MNQQITCPRCKQIYDLSEVFTGDLQKQFEEEYARKQEKQEAELAQRLELLQQQEAAFLDKKRKENEIFEARLKQKMAEEVQQIQRQEAERNAEVIAQMKKMISDKEKEMQDLRKLEIDKMKLENELKLKEEEWEIRLEKQQLELAAKMREELSRDILEKERERYDLEKRQLEKKLADQTRLTHEMQRKLDQGSMQTQGETMELAIEEMLTREFPFDILTEVKKGQHGADCILEVQNTTGHSCGKIVLESKNAEHFSKEWIPKLKSDLQRVQGEVAVLVTRNLPKDMKTFDLVEGIWICRMQEMIPLIKSLREHLIGLSRLKESQVNKGEKKEMLYNFFISNEFRQHIRAINEAYIGLKMGLVEEQNKMQKIWKAREKQIDKVLLNNNHLIGSIEGITGEQMEDRETEETE